MSDILLDLSGLTLRYGAVTALDDVSLRVPRGGTLGIVGESGSGKSTLAACILRLLPPAATIDAGRILFDGDDLLGLSAERMRRLRGSRISFISQDPLRALVPTLSVGQLMTDIQFRRSESRAAKRRRAVDMLEKVGVPDPEQRLASYPHELSGGQRQRVSIAMAMMVEPALLIADEPTTALDATIEAQILDLLKQLQRDVGCSMIFVTHDLGTVPVMCDEVAVMRHGIVREAGPVTTVFNNPADDYTRILLRCDPARIKTPTRRLPTTADPLDAPIHIEAGPADRIKIEEAPVLAVESLCVTFRRRSIARRLRGRGDFLIEAVKGATLSVQPGETVALVGESGSGKTTLARTVMGLIRPDSGSIRIGERDVTKISRRDMNAVRREVAMMFQDPVGSLSPRFKIGSLVTEPLRVHRRKPGDLDAEALRLLDLVGLTADYARRYPHELSGGQARRVGVARALALSPKLLIADEPTAGLDLSIQGEVLNLLAEIQERTGVAMLVITHNLAVVRHVSDRTVVMYQGEFLEEGPTEAIFAAPQHDYTRRLLAASRHDQTRS